MNVNSFSAADFDGETRLFPLPNLVMFPHVLQALHIFEPRYVELFESALATDRLFALGLLQNGWEPEYEGRPPVYPTVCLCQIVTHKRREDSLYDAVVFGVSRATIKAELQPAHTFRKVQLELLADEVTTKCAESNHLEECLLSAVDELMPGNAPMIRQLREQSAPDATLSILTDLLAYSLPLETELKQRLLSNTCVMQRAQCLLGHLSKINQPKSGGCGGFPPQFSDN